MLSSEYVSTLLEEDVYKSTFEEKYDKYETQIDKIGTGVGLSDFTADTIDQELRTLAGDVDLCNVQYNANQELITALSEILGSERDLNTSKADGFMEVASGIQVDESDAPLKEAQANYETRN